MQVDEILMAISKDKSVFGWTMLFARIGTRWFITTIMEDSYKKVFTETCAYDLPWRPGYFYKNGVLVRNNKIELSKPDRLKYLVANGTTIERDIESFRSI